MGCIELCEDVHTAWRQTSSQISIGHCSDYIGFSPGVCVGVRQYEHTIKPSGWVQFVHKAHNHGDGSLNK